MRIDFQPSPKKLSASLLECLDLISCLNRFVILSIRLRPADERNIAWLDFLHRFGRKWGMIASAIKTRQLSQW